MEKGITHLVIVLVIFAATIVTAVGILAWRSNLPIPSKQNACTLDAKVCPDGSTVKRTGELCYFQDCPAFDSTNTKYWKTYLDPNGRFSFQHPTLDPQYIDTKLNQVTFGCGCELFTWFTIQYISTSSKPLDWWNSVGKKNLVNTKTLTKQINGQDVLVADAETPTLKATPSHPAIPLGGLQERIYIFQFKGGILVVSQNFVSKDQDAQFEEIIKSFKLTEESAARASWKTYTNPVIGLPKFEFKYPPDYKLSHTEEFVFILEKSGETISGKFVYSEFSQKNFESNYSGGVKLLRTTTVGGHQAFVGKFVEGSGDIVWIDVGEKDRVLELGSTKDNSNEFSQILPTFKFN